jgi:hypothetical protein
MTIDERIGKLTERHEALAQTVELLAIENRQTSHLVAQLAEAMTRLAKIVEGHEHRITGLEGGAV